MKKSIKVYRIKALIFTVKCSIMKPLQIPYSDCGNGGKHE